MVQEINSINHWAVFLSNNSNTQILINQLLECKATKPFTGFNRLKGVLFSTITLNEFIEEEAKHEHSLVLKNTSRTLKSMSSGERKKALLAYLLSQQPDFIILDNPFDNLDIASQKLLLDELTQIGIYTAFIQLINRKNDQLSFIKNTLTIGSQTNDISSNSYLFSGSIPPPIKHYKIDTTTLVEFKNVTIKYDDRTIVNTINWTINAGEFWQLVGPNGSGKTTLLTLINGDNPKAYGQNLYLFGKRKGSGETVWDIKEKIGYLTPAMTDLFSTRHTLEQMIISGFFDSIGLYKLPTDIQLKLANQWLILLEMGHLKNTPFCKLSLGQQRMALIARAMVKHPPLLILDEPNSGLDDHNVSVLSALINKIAAESTTAILYVSHRTEKNITPQFVYELLPTNEGSMGFVR
ncbi:MAG: ATP-binding cassette domain-containing protein [Flavobacterium sp.]|nr:ATP-binding cassette domain-containing protein [Flavobacterium sp.]